MSDPRLESFARILVDYCTHILPGDRVFIETSTEALPMLQEVYKQVLQRGGHPYLQMEFPEQRELYFEYMPYEPAAHKNELMAQAYEHFEARIRIWSEANTKALMHADTKKQSAWAEGNSSILKSQFERGAAGDFRWVTTLYPTRGYASQAGMGFIEYEDFVYKAVHAPEKDPVAHWKSIKVEQEKYIHALNGHDRVQLRGPNVDLSLSIKDRTFANSYGLHNMPDGEIFTGPVENSLNGWVRYTYPAVEMGVVVEGAELQFEDGKVVKATARQREDFLNQMTNTDAGSSYVGEFAFGLNKDIDRFTGHILFDEKIGGSFHMALGAGYPETGSKNNSAIHWDMICDLR
ncbi:MAG: aminopeptidase [Chloroflexi bacterium]|nr:aminopeptidase [Chloroflexota bacterium]